MESTNNDEVAHQFRFFRAYKDGRVEILYNTQKVPPSTDTDTGVQSKDVTISPQVSARIFLPKINDPAQKLPILFYIHGGGFCFESAFSPLFHKHLTTLAASASANAVAVSVEYGLFPDRPIPACYDDTWAALKWVQSHSTRNGPDPWLNQHADFDRVFLCGDSGGANMCNNLAVRVGSEGLPGVKIPGMVFVHPFFGGLEKDDEMWVYMCKESNGGVYDRKLKPPPEDLAKLACGKVLIFFAEKDHLREVGQWYYDELKKSEWSGSVEFVEHKDEFHEFHLLSEPEGEKALDLIKKFGDFIKQN